MLCVESWQSGINLTLAESRGGVRVTSHPLENMVQYAKLTIAYSGVASEIFMPATFSKVAIRKMTGTHETVFGYYCDLQSLNSEDAVTWELLRYTCLYVSRNSA